MTERRFRWLINGVVLVTVALPTAATAHEKWFINPADYPLHAAAIWGWRTWAALGLALAVIAVASLLARQLQRQSAPAALTARIGFSDERLQGLYNWVPLLLAVHTAVPLLVNGIQLDFLAPNLRLARDGLGAFLALGQIAVALSLVYGALVRWSTLGLMLLWAAGLAVFGLVGAGEHVVYVGIAIFLYLVGRGPFSVDALIGAKPQPHPDLVGYAVPALRIAMGLSIALLGFTEKLWNLPMGLAFLHAYPLNFMPALGFGGFSDTMFVTAAGFVEVVAGVLLMSGYFTRVAILVLWLPFNLTLPLLGWAELVGHLPIYGIMVVLLIWGAQPTPSVLRGLRQLARGREVSASSLG